MAFPPAALASLAKEVGSLLIAQQATVALCETTTGGLITAALLSTPGASRFVLGSTVSFVSIGASALSWRRYSLPARRALNAFTDADFKGYESV